MHDRLIDLLTKLARQQSRPYSCAVTYNNQTENWDIKSPSSILEVEDSLQIIPNAERDLRRSIQGCVLGIKSLGGGNDD
jgi:hypothetical protein